MRSARTAHVLLALSAVIQSGCRRSEGKSSRTELTLPPLTSPAPVTALAVPGSGDAVVAIPIGAIHPAPVVVAVLGIGDTPESQCAAWRELVDGRAFVLCPRGLPHWVQEEVADAGGDRQEEDASPAPPGQVKQVGYYHPDVAVLERELDAALGALRARWGSYVAQDGAIYAGFSRGAFLGAALVAKQPRLFKRAVLIEGGQTPWTEDTASSFADGGGERVLFACGQPACVDEARGAAAILGRRKVEVRVVHGEGEGHGYKRQVKDEVRRSLDWVTAGDARWRQLFADRATYK